MSDAKLKPIATVKFETELKPARDLGKPGKFKMIPLSQLYVDERYQRSVGACGKKNISRIIENFRWSRFTPLVVSARKGGRYAVMDGQHRALAALSHGGIKAIPCFVMACSPEEEADAFATMNGNVTRMQTQYLFKARLAAGEKTAKLAAAVAAEAGVRIMSYPVPSNLLKKGETLASGTIESCIARFGREQTIAALKFITKTGDGNTGLVKADIIETFAQILYFHPRWFAAKDKVRAAIAAKGLRELYASGLKAAAAADTGFRAAFKTKVEAEIKAAVGEGGVAPERTLLEIERSAQRKGAAHKNLARAKEAQKSAGRGGKTSRRPFEITKPKTQVTQDTRALIDAHLKKHGTRKFESGATGNIFNLLEWLTNVCKIKSNYIARGPGGKQFRIGGKFHDLSGLIRIVNRERAKRKLIPITAEQAA